MTTSLANLLLGVDMEGGENFCDSVYNFLKNQGKDINLFTNSGFGVWSQSDTNKGLGICTVDSGSTVPTVGETVTGATSGATAKVAWMDNQAGDWGTNAGTGDIYLGACVGRFNDNEDLDGSVSGANFATVNMPDAAVGVDLVRNGEFEAGVGGWTANNCALASVGLGQVGNCLQLTLTGGAFQSASQGVSLTVGKIYKISFYVKSGTSGNEAFSGVVYGNGGANLQIDVAGTSAAGWVLYTGTFECSVNTNPFLHLYKQTATAGTMFFDEVTLYEITPCCTAADTVAFDGSEKGTDADLYREHNGVNTKDGSFYALAIVPTTAGHDAMVFPRAISALEEWYMQFQGRPVTFGMWVLAYSANHARIRIQDSVDSTYSDYHTGGGDYEWLEVTKVVDAGATSMQFKLTTTLAGDIDGTTLVYVSQDMAVFGWSLGEGMYQPRQQEIIWLEALLSDNPLSGLGLSSIGYTDVNVEANSDARIPKGCKAIFMLSRISDSGSAGADCYLNFRADATQIYQYSNTCGGLVNNLYSRVGMWQKCGAGGDFQYTITASGAGNFDIDGLHYIGVQVN